MRAVADCQTSVRLCANAVRERRISAREIAEETLDAIARVDRHLQAFTAVDPEHLLDQAKVVDASIARGEAVGSLAGVPIAAKDFFEVRGLPTSYGCPAFDPYVANGDSDSVGQLRAAGALLAGKTRAAELGWSDTTPPTKNPRDSRLIPGGSSGGSAAAVGAALVLAALGTDTGGSIRMPAAMCGVVGLKPTYRVVSLEGVLPCSWSLDHAGPLARSVADVRIVLDALCAGRKSTVGSDALLVSELRQRLGSRQHLKLAGLRLATLDEPLFEIVESRSQALYTQLLDLLADSGASLLQLRLPEVRLAPAVALAISMSEGASIHQGLLRDRGHLITPEIRESLELASVVPAALVARARGLRLLLKQRVAALFVEHRLDALVVPANTAPPIPADNLAAVFPRKSGQLEQAMWWGYPRVNYLANVTGQPAIVLPITEESPPIGVQLVGRPYEDDRLLDIAEAVEERLERQAA